MRLYATGRALRASSSRWSIASSSRRIRPACFQQQSTRVAAVRYASTPTAKQSAPAAETPTEGRASQLNASSIGGVTVENKTYTTDEWSNAPPHILSHVGRCLYLDENHPLAITRKLIESVFPSPVYGNYVEPQPIVTPSENFDVLGFPPDHPGRSRTDTYYVNKERVLRTHSSAHQQRYFQRMSDNEKTRPEEKGYTLMADVYRRDAIDRSHYPVFHQMELARLWKRPSDEPNSVVDTIRKDLETIPRHDVKVEDPNPTFHAERNPLQEGQITAEETEVISTHLKRSLERLVVKIFTEASKASASTSAAAQEPLKVRWIEAYFPFTSPSYELEVFYQGDWLEVLGCGVIKKDLLNSSNVPEHIGWAAGLGIERIAMLLFNIPDIRLFWSQDERFLSQFKAGQITRFVPFSKHPACYKDVSFWLRSSSASGGGGLVPFHENDMMEVVRAVAGDLVEDVTPVDEFTHPKTGRKSVCYRINYRCLERTLTNEETNDLHDKVRERLVEKLGVELR